MTGRAFLIGAFGLVVVRMCLPAHAPALVDAHVCLAALALALVAGAPKHALLAASLVVGGAVLSIPTSWDPWISLLALPAALGPAAFFVLASSGAARNAMLWGVGVGGALNAVVAVVQKTITWPNMLAHAAELGLDPTTVTRLQQARPLGLSLSPDLCGGLCLAGAFAALALALDVADNNKRVALAALSAVSASGVLVTRSFGTGLALALGAGAAALWFTARHGWQPAASSAPSARSREALIVGAAGAVVAVVALGAAFVVRGSEALSVSAGERIENWKAAVAIAQEHPLLGVGFMRFAAAYLTARSPDANLTIYAHSTPLEYLAEGGIVGALCVVLAFAVGARALWRRRDSLLAGDVVLAGGALAYAARLAIDYDGHVAQSASTAGVLWGLVLATGAPSPAPPLQRRLLGVALAFAGILTAVLFWRDGVLEGDASTPEGQAALQSYADRVPVDVVPRLKIAQQALDALDTCTKPEGCGEAATRAHAALDAIVEDREHPPSAALVLRARVWINEGKLHSALKDVDRALVVDPGNALAHQLGISIVRTAGEPDEARVAEAARWHVTAPAAD